MRIAPEPKAWWTKDKAGAFLAATTGYLFAAQPVVEMTKRLIQDYAYRAGALVSLVIAALCYWVGLRVMRKLP